MFGERVKTLRKEKKMTQSQLAEIAGVTKGTVALWEQGQRKPSLTVVKKLSEFFDRSVDYILGNTDDAMPIHMDSDYLGLTDVSDQYSELFEQYLALDDYGQKAVKDLILNETRRCVDMKTKRSDYENAFNVAVYFKPEIAEAERHAPHNPALDTKDTAASDFITDEE